MLCPERRDKHGKPEEPSEFELNHIRKDKAKLKVIRSPLSDISWWMRFAAALTGGVRLCGHLDGSEAVTLAQENTLPPRAEALNSRAALSAWPSTATPHSSCRSMQTFCVPAVRSTGVKPNGVDLGNSKGERGT